MPVFGKRRALGQHFLRDQGIIDLIARTAMEEAARTGCRALLEVGPGKGAITHPLLALLETQSWTKAHIERFVIVEADRQLAANWKQNASAHALEKVGPFEILVEEGDFVQLPEEKWLISTPLAVASNLPYSAGTAIVTRLARHTADIPVMVLMFQAEVAQRLRAEPNTKAWGSLSIWIQNHWDVRKLCAVPPNAFSPPPDVDSEVVILKRRELPRIAIPADRVSQERWEKLLKAAFAHRRKMLRSGLRAHPAELQALEKSGIDLTKRAEALTWDEWNLWVSGYLMMPGALN
ncbi:16S rRNA (adenine(1518)-N(6)/adenine(1519)-N(6))-dimethyltransferase RsmA [Bdellovibrionota bacterium FG-1]